jgi:hypothetical protein
MKKLTLGSKLGTFLHQRLRNLAQKEKAIAFDVDKGQKV